MTCTCHTLTVSIIIPMVHSKPHQPLMLTMRSAAVVPTRQAHEPVAQRWLVRTADGHILPVRSDRLTSRRAGIGDGKLRLKIFMTIILQAATQNMARSKIPGSGGHLSCQAALGPRLDHGTRYESVSGCQRLCCSSMYYAGTGDADVVL